MRFSTVLALSGAIALSGATAAFAGDPESCKTVRFSDVGWTDITSTTAIASEILKGLGYTPKITVLSVPVTYASMKNKDIDVFLGNWEPSMENDRKPYVDDKSVVVVGANLPVGAKYTLAVPQYTYDKGLKDSATSRSSRTRFMARSSASSPAMTATASSSTSSRGTSSA